MTALPFCPQFLSCGDILPLTCVCACVNDFVCQGYWVTWVNVFRIIPEFRILSLTFHRIVESQPQNAELGTLYYRPLAKCAYQKIFSYFLTKTYVVVGTQKNRLNETVLLSTQNLCFK